MFTKCQSSSCYVDDQVLELMFENSYLRGELSLYEEYWQVLLDLKYMMVYASGVMDEALSEATCKLKDANQSHLKLYGIEEKEEDGLDF
ncbi:hypothetical protein FQN50_009140 [Emmonsiellopsis sp. PD_5]|nr:hypothetical protein FQN50_009140 [Emmonsiellopsis sp. PD_5]